MRLVSDQESLCLVEDIRLAIEPFDVAGLSDSSKKGWYPVDAEDLLQSACKVESTRGEIESLLRGCGYYRTEAG